MTIERLSDLAAPDPHRFRRLLGRDRDHDSGFSRAYREGGWTGRGQIHAAVDRTKPVLPVHVAVCIAERALRAAVLAAIRAFAG